MGKTLRLGFAMGGGTSLGTFNGAALSEAIKLAILRGIDSEGNRFEKVEVDVFSGASAGAMSLGLMLRGLVHQTDKEIKTAKQHLQAQFNGDPDFINLSPNKKKDLIAAQVVQDTQEKIWVRGITIDGMLENGPRGKESGKTRYTGGILNRAAVDRIAKKYFAFPGAVDLSRRRVLADRVLYACTLTNITPIFADAREQFPIAKGGLPALAEGMTTKVHRELRVFDLSFDDISKAPFADRVKHPERWVRYHASAERKKKIGNLMKPKAWAKMAATAVASGAFPLAFEPVVLKRDWWEFGEVLWPFDKNSVKDYNFTYVDGGSFNNEPIREAFRMASFIDARTPGGNFERCIVFVDPNVEKPEPNFRVPVHQRYLLDDPNIFGTFDGYDLERSGSLDRLLPHGISLAGGVIDQAKSIEGDKIFRVRKKSQQRTNIRKLLAATLVDNPRDAELKKLRDFCQDILDKDRERMMIPPGTLTVAGELERVISEPGNAFLEPIKGLASGFVEDIAGAGHKELWLRALSFVAVDVVMNLTGKNVSSKLIAIAPVTNPTNKKNPGFVSLPGGRVAGFAGFTSPLAGEYEVKLGRWCTQNFMQLAKLITKNPLPQLPDFKNKEVAFQHALEAGVDKLADRLFAMIAQGHVPWLSAAPQWLTKFIFKSKLTKVAKKKRDEVTYEFRIKLPRGRYEKFEFDGPGLGDRDIGPIQIGADHYLITFATLDRKTGVWRGPHLTGGDDGGGNEDSNIGTAIAIDKDGLLMDSDFCTVELPKKKQIEAADLLPYPIFIAKIAEADEDKDLDARRWMILKHDPDVVPLTDTIFD